MKSLVCVVSNIYYYTQYISNCPRSRLLKAIKSRHVLFHRPRLSSHLGFLQLRFLYMVKKTTTKSLVLPEYWQSSDLYKTNQTVSYSFGSWIFTLRRSSIKSKISSVIQFCFLRLSSAPPHSSLLPYSTSDSSIPCLFPALHSRIVRSLLASVPGAYIYLHLNAWNAVMTIWCWLVASITYWQMPGSKMKR